MGATSLEILDLRHFGAPMLRAVLDSEAELWKKRLHWDYRASAQLLMQYLDNHMLPGYAAVEAERVTGYVFCVYEETKAVIGDVFATDAKPHGPAPVQSIEEKLLRHLLELLVNSPHIDRIESQLLLHPSGTHAATFREAGCRIFRRLFLVQQISDRWKPPRPNLPDGLELRPWRENDLAAASRLIADAYRGHPDGLINDQYRSAHGSMRFLNNIVRYSGCGTFSATVSHVVAERGSKELVALVLGSRVSHESGHITQICVAPSYRRMGLARTLLSVVSYGFMRQGASEISLTVTEANQEAIDLYVAEGYTLAHSFDAAVWERSRQG
ncbi:MAG TPA: N-acetyltransferase, partial [Terracidiphilus sp.]|nr:N-acetyltransferase [Terracidiphilus sp.]